VKLQLVYRVISSRLMKYLPVAFSICAAVALAAGLTDTERKIVQSIETGLPDSDVMLERLVNINSGTLNAAGVRQVADVLRPEFEKLGFTVRWIPMDEVHRAGHLVAQRRGTHGKRVLLIGHMDTVFEPSSPFQTYRRQSDAAATGPGSSDMKGGLVVILYSLRALESAGALEGTSITVFLTGDEEKPGDPLTISRRDLVEAAKVHDVALEFESGTRSGGREYATIARRSSASWTLRASGNTGHSSGVFGSGVGSGAIYEMARILSAFHDQLREPDLTYNVSVALGGSTLDYNQADNTGSAAGKTNIIPDKAVASGDIRAISAEQQERTREKMRQIVAAHLPGTGAEITFQDGYPAMPATAGNERLLATLNEANRDLNLENLEALPPGRRGAGDVSFVAPYLDALSGLGSLGRNAHIAGESIELARQPIQMKRTALLVYRLTR
jgi:glutamate carboxypeptidase